jgi:hypothetical protein
MRNLVRSKLLGGSIESGGFTLQVRKATGKQIVGDDTRLLDQAVHSCVWRIVVLVVCVRGSGRCSDRQLFQMQTQSVGVTTEQRRAKRVVHCKRGRGAVGRPTRADARADAAMLASSATVSTVECW